MEVDALDVKIVEKVVDGKMNDDAKDAEEKGGVPVGWLQGRAIVEVGAAGHASGQKESKQHPQGLLWL